MSTKNAKSVDKLAKTATCPPKPPISVDKLAKMAICPPKTGISVDEIPDQVGDDEEGTLNDFHTCIIE